MKKTVCIFFFLLLPNLFLSCSNGPEITAIFKGDASIKITADSIDITEGGSEGSFSVSLTSRPENDVSISFELTDTSEAIITPQNITFTPDDYSTGQAVLVTGLSDCVTDGDQVLKIIIADVTSNDSRYQLSENSLLYEEIDLTVRDDITGKPELLLLSNNPTIQTTESGGDDKFLVALSCAPSAPVTVYLTSSNMAEGILDIQSVTLDSSNYSLGRLITVTGQSDCTNEADISYSITADTADEVDNSFDFLSTSKPAVNQNVILSPSIMVIQSSGQVNRGAGAYNNFQAKLSCEPPADEIMSVTVNGLPNGYTLFSPLAGTHTFTAANWNTPIDVILQITSDLDGAYQIDLSSTTYGNTSVYFGDSGTKRLTVNVTGLAGKTTLANGSDSISFQAPGTFYWHLATGFSYTLELSEQPAGQVCAIAEQQFGVTTTPFTININCINGYANGISILLNDPAAMPPLPDDLMTVTTIAGALPPTATSGAAVAGPVSGSTARFNNPFGMTSDGSNIYMTDYGNNTVRKIEMTAPYNVTTIAGDGTAGALDGNGTVAQFNNPANIVTNGTSLYLAEKAGNKIRKIDLVGGNYTVSTITTTTVLDTPTGLALLDNSLYVATRGGNSCSSAGFLLRIDLATGQENIIVNGLNEPLGVTTDGTSIYVSEFCTDKILKYDLTGTLLKVYGSGIAGHMDGEANIAKFNEPNYILYHQNTLYVGEGQNGGLRKINLLTNRVSTILNAIPGYADGDFSSARIKIFAGKFTTDGRSLYYSDFSNHAIRKISSGLAAHYPLAGDTKDYSGNGNDLIPDKGADATGLLLKEDAHGKSSAAYYFDGTDNLRAATFTNLPTGNASRTMCGWIRPAELPSPDSFYIMVSYGAASGTGTNSAFGIGNLGSVINIYAGANQESVLAPYFVEAGKWYHVCSTYRSNAGFGDISLYVNGKFVKNGTLTDWVTSPTGSIAIGSWSSNVAHFQNGDLSDVRIYNRVLTAPEIKRLATRIPDGIVAYYPLDSADQYNDGLEKIRDYSVYAKDGLLGGDGLTASAFPAGNGVDRHGNYNSAYRFDGVNDYIRAADKNLPAGSSARTMCAWVKSENVVAAPFSLLYGTTNPGVAGEMSGLEIGPDRTALAGWDMGTGVDLYASPTIDYEWLHICGTYQGTNGKVYINGVLDASSTTLTPWNTQVDAADTMFTMGSLHGASLFLKGELDDIRIYNRILSDKEILILADKPFNPTEGLVAWYPLDDGAGATAIQDRSGNGNHAVPYRDGIAGTALDSAVGPHGNGNGAIDFQASGNLDKILASDAGLPSGKTPRSICAWIKPKTIPPAGVGIVGYGTNSDGAANGLSIGNGIISYYGIVTDFVALTQNTLEVWSHICGTFDGANGNIYQNGKKINGPVAISWNTQLSGSLYIGQFMTADRSFDGSISDVRIYNRPLSNLEVARLATQVPDGLAAYYPMDDLFSNGTDNLTSDITAGNWHAVLGDTGLADGYEPAQTTDRYGSSNSAYYFGGDGDYLRIFNKNELNYALSSDFTISLWINTQNLPGTDMDVLSKWDPGLPYPYVIRESPLGVTITAVHDGTNSAIVADMTPGIYRYKHIVLQRNSGFLSLFINGIFIDTTNDSTLGSVTNLYDITIGRRYSNQTAGNNYNGIVDDLRFYSRALNNEEIFALAQGPGQKKSETAGSVSFNMVFVPPKTFYTGTDDSGTASVDKAYWIGETEVTYELWYEVYQWAIGNGYTFANTGIPGHDGTAGTETTSQEPVTTINWRDAMIFTNALTEYYNSQNGTSLECVYTSDAAYTTCIRISTNNTTITYGALGSEDNPYVNPNAKGFRLPTNKEWELAARYIDDANYDGDILDAGEYYPGSHISGDTTNPYDTSSASGNYGWYVVNSSSVTHDVATKTANALGLYDMSGNVWEWAFDWYPGFEGSFRVGRGGSWNYSAFYMQVGSVVSFNPYDEVSDFGFRLARTP